MKLLYLILLGITYSNGQGGTFRFTVQGKGPNKETIESVELGNDVMLDCTTTDSGASLRLLRQEGTVDKEIPVDGVKLTRTGQQFTLNIAKIGDGGDLVCVAAKDNKYITKKFVIYAIPKGHGSRPQALLEPSSLMLDKNKQIQINCSAPGATTVLKWTKEKKDVDQKFIQKLVYRVAGLPYTKLILAIPKAQKSDGGIYECHSSTPLNPSFEDEEKIQVKIKDTDVKWVSNDGFINSASANAGASGIIDCSLTSADTKVRFFKQQYDGSSTEIIPNGKKYVTQQKQKLIIKEVTRQDGLQYFCRAPGIADKTVTLFVNSAAATVIIVSVSAKFMKLEYLETRKLNCQSRGNDIVLEWYKETKDGLDMQPVSSDRTELNGYHTPRGGYVKELYLKFDKATTRDSGIYVCKVHKYGIPSSSKYERVRVRVRDAKKPVIKSFRSHSLMQGRNASFLCNVKGSPRPNVSFWKGSRKITNKWGKYHVDFDVLTVQNVRYPDDDGDIKCQAESKLGKTTATAKLTVKVFPVLVPKDDLVFSSKNQTTNITCVVKAANPMPYVTWKLQPSACSFTESDCQPLADAWETLPAGKFKVRPPANTLTMKSVLEVRLAGYDYFFIQCTADNGLRKVHQVTKYINKKDTKKLLTVTPTSVVQNEGKPLSLSCFGTPGSFSNLAWFKDGKLVKEENGLYLISEKTPHYMQKLDLYINVSLPTHSGSYVCNGTRKVNKNELVTEKVNVQIKATYKPVVKPLTNVVTNQNATIILHCQVDANPAANVTWLKDGTELTNISPLFDVDNCKKSENGHYYRMSGPNHRNELVICKACFQKNNATYACVAKNDLGSASTSAVVIVYAMPSIVRVKTSSYINVGDKLEEKCFAIGNPRPMVWWEKKIDGKYFQLGKKMLSRSYLNFKKIRKEEFGDYRCVAENSRGITYSKFAISKLWTGASAADLDRSNKAAKYTLIATVAVASVLIVLLTIIVVVLYKRRRLYGGFYIFTVPPAPDYLKKIDPSRALSEQTNKLPYDVAWEFPRTRVKLMQKLGSGAFGEVFSAEAVGILAHDPRYKILTKQRPLLGRRRASRSGSTSSRTGGSTSSGQGLLSRGSFSRGSFTRNGSTRGSYRSMKGYKNLVSKVAVKKLKGDATPLELRDLISELKILIHIGEHPNIVNLLGACTKGKEGEMMVILEYAPYGNLLSFLKDRRPTFKATLSKQVIGMEKELTTLDLVIVAYQVAKGMEYLSSRKCVHRDLAARNVLVGDNYVMKIADFGLARDIYKDDRYVKVTGGLLPIKWMALEAIRERVFTHQSDVWSFGVLLWELMTLGGSPYPGMPTKDLLDFLAAGYRMEQPLNCPPEIYSVMRDCWHEDPNDRPIFFETVNQLARFVEQNCNSDECVSYLDAAHMTGSDYLRPVDSPAPVFTPLPYPTNDDIRRNDNRFFNSDNGYLRCNREDTEKENIALSEVKSGSEGSNTSERKRKADEKEREKRTTSDSDSSQKDPFDVIDGKGGQAHDTNNGTPFDEDKDIDETEMLLNQPATGAHRYINEDIMVFEDRSYINA